MKENTTRMNRVFGDCGYGWVVVASSFCIYFIVDGLFYSFGILFVELLEYFQQDRASTVVIGSILFGFIYLTGPLAGALSRIYGCRIICVAGALISCSAFLMSYFATSVLFLCITYGFLGGVGLGLMFLPAGVCVIQHFTKHRAQANGIACCGSGVGTFVMNHLTRYLLDKYGLRGTMLLQGGIALQGVFLGLLLLPPKHKPGNNDMEKASSQNENNRDRRRKGRLRSEKTCCSCLFPSAKDHSGSLELEKIDVNAKHDQDLNDEMFDNANSGDVEKGQKLTFVKRLVHLICNRELLTSGKFWSFLICNFTVQLAFTVPYNLLADQSVEQGIEKHRVSWLMASIGITNTVGRVLLGWLADNKCINRLSMLKFILLLAGLSTAVSPLFTSFETKLLYACSYGFLVGGYVVLCPVLLADLFGEVLIAQSVGLWLFACGLAGTFATPLGGWLFDMTGTYDITFLVAGIEFVVGGLLLFIPKCIIRIERKG